MEVLFGEGDYGINSRRPACRDGARGKGDERECCHGEYQNKRIARANAEQLTLQRPPERYRTGGTKREARCDQQ